MWELSPSRKVLFPVHVDLLQQQITLLLRDLSLLSKSMAPGPVMYPCNFYNVGTVSETLTPKSVLDFSQAHGGQSLKIL